MSAEVWGVIAAFAGVGAAFTAVFVAAFFWLAVCNSKIGPGNSVGASERNAGSGRPKFKKNADSVKRNAGNGRLRIKRNDGIGWLRIKRNAGNDKLRSRDFSTLSTGTATTKAIQRLFLRMTTDSNPKGSD